MIFDNETALNKSILIVTFERKDKIIPLT